MSIDIFYRDKAERYAPKTAAEIERAAKELAADGFSDHTISSILKVDVNAVRTMIGSALSQGR